MFMKGSGSSVAFILAKFSALLHCLLATQPAKQLHSLAWKYPKQVTSFWLSVYLLR